MNPAETVIMVGAVVAAVTGMGIFAMKVWKILKRIDGVLGVDRQGRTISERLDRVEHQLFPNGGSSLSDKIGKIEREQGSLQAQIHSLHAMLLGLLGGNKDGAGRAS